MSAQLIDLTDDEIGSIVDALSDVAENASTQIEIFEENGEEAPDFLVDCAVENEYLANLIGHYGQATWVIASELVTIHQALSEAIRNCIELDLDDHAAEYEQARNKINRSILGL